MTPEQYTSEDAISKTGLDYIEKSPLDYWWRFLNPEREAHVKDKDMLFEEAFRCSVLTPVEFSKLYVKQPPIKRTNNFGKAEYASLVATVESNGQILMSAASYETIVAMRDAVLSHPTTKLLFDNNNGYPGEPLRFEEANSGAIVKFCPHWVHIRTGKKLIVNLMSTENAGKEKFSKEAYDLKLHKRAALQMDGLVGSAMVFVMVERSAPYKLQVHSLDDRSIDLGRSVYVENCVTYMECLESGKWPGLPEKIQPASLPDWVFKNY